MHDPATPHLAAPAIRTGLDGLRESQEINLRYASVDAILCFNARLLYDSIVNALAEWEPEWDEGCSNWGGAYGQRFNDSLDGFLHGIQAVQASLKTEDDQVKGKGKAREGQVDDEDIRLVILVEHAERLKEHMPDMLVPLARLRELVSPLLYRWMIINEP